MLDFLMDVDTTSILVQLLDSYKNVDKWSDSPFKQIKRISNSVVGSVGQDFVEKLCEQLEFECKFPENREGRRTRVSPWDIMIEGRTFELKTATLGVNGAFQFNHVRYHRQYEALLCIGISPTDIYFGSWTKGEVVTGQAGTLATMEKGANASFKLTKRIEQLHPIADFVDELLNTLIRLDT